MLLCLRSDIVIFGHISRVTYISIVLPVFCVQGFQFSVDIIKNNLDQNEFYFSASVWNSHWHFVICTMCRYVLCSALNDYTDVVIFVLILWFWHFIL